MFHWEKLSPEEFKTFHEYVSESNKKLLEVVDEYTEGCRDSNIEITLDYCGFCRFMSLYIESPGIPEELCRRLFVSFLKKPRKISVKSHGHLSKSDSNSLVPVDKLSKLSFPASSLSEPTEIKTMLNFVERQKGFLKCATGSSGSCSSSGSGGGGCRRSTDISAGRILLKDLICCLSLLEAGRPEDKLEFLFRLYDTDANGILDSEEIECIINHMMTVAKYSGWDVSELKPNLQEMMREVDLNDDGCVTLEEWMKAGSSNIPLVVLLGVDSVVTDEGCHSWELKHFNRPAYCNYCLSLLVGLGKQGLRCIYCRYTVHERCVKECKQGCIETYNKSRTLQAMHHHWVDGNCLGKCDVCNKYIKAYNKLTGMKCRWCHISVHNKCTQQVAVECSMGPCKQHILSPMQISPSLLHQSRKAKTRHANQPCMTPKSSSSSLLASSPPKCSLTDAIMEQPNGTMYNEATVTYSTSEVFADNSTTGLITSSSNNATTIQPVDCSSTTNKTTSLSLTTTTTNITSIPTTTTTSTTRSIPSTTSAADLASNSTSTSLTSIDDLNQPCSHSYTAFQLVALEDVVPLLVFINPKSGGKQGRGLLKKFKYILNPRQVFNVATDNGFMHGLNFFRDLPNYRVLVCGGDGTIGWLLESMDKMNYDIRPSVAILPLGTGNDLARSLRWGGGYEGEDLHKVLERISKGCVVMLDRWRLDIKMTPLPPNASPFSSLTKGLKNTDLSGSDVALTYFSKTSSQKKCVKDSGEGDLYNSSPNILIMPASNDDTRAVPNTATTTTAATTTATTKPACSMVHKPPCNIINNYFSIGVDASIAHRFHVMREKHPERFNSRMKNKLWYLEYGTSETLKASCKNLHESINIICDNTPLDMIHGRSMEGVAILNIANIYGGSNLWGDSIKVKKKRKGGDSDRELSSGSSNSVDLSATVQDMGDGLVEMVGLLNTMHMAKVKGGIHSGKRLAQASSFTIQTTKEFPMQIDGEPWIQPPCTLTISHENQVPLLMAATPNKRSVFSNWFSSK